MPKLSADQLETLAKRYTQFATSINTFLDDNDVADQTSYDQLSSDAMHAANAGATLAVQAAATTFDDAAGAFVKLDAATMQANAAAATLKNEVASISRGIKIAAGMLSLAAALATGNVPNVLSSVTAIHSAFIS
ncbi:MAG TPA: hypothetical protein VGF98_05110 [Candidatus Tumulicola sp.]